jgi:hypothetical protein
MATSHHSQNIAAFSINKPYLLEYSFTVLSFSSGCFAQTIVCDIVLWQMDIRQPANGFHCDGRGRLAVKPATLKSLIGETRQPTRMAHSS